MSLKKEDLYKTIFNEERIKKPISYWYKGSLKTKMGYEVDFGEKEIDPQLTDKLVKFYKQRMVLRMERFHFEAKRMDKKVKEIHKALANLGVVITKTVVTKRNVDLVTHHRKRSKGLLLTIEAYRERLRLKGSMRITPASIRLGLVADGWAYEKPTFEVVYYRSMVVRDNLLATMVHGRQYPKEEVKGYTLSEIG